MSDTAELLWTPSEARKRAARMTDYAAWLAREQGLTFAGYDDMWQWSVDHLEDFWASIWRYFGVPAVRPYTRVLADARMPGAHWFEGAQLNFVDQVFRHRDIDTPAIVYESEAGGSGELSWAELERQVAALAATLRGLGVAPGDRVAAYLPNLPQTVVAFLAVASIGAVWSICAPEMGLVSVRDRFSQIEPKVLIACDGYRFGGKPFDRRAVLREVLDGLPSVQAVLWVPHLDRDDDAGPVCGARKLVHWAEAVVGAGRLEPAALPFDHPLWIVYSSGTTGLPKPIVHGHGGILVNGLVTNALHNDLGPGSRYFCVVSTGWIVWNIQVSALLAGATICLYDGSVSGAGVTPDWSFLWRFVARHRVTSFGAGAAFYASCLKAEVKPKEIADLSALKGLTSTGSPLSPECYRWIYDAVKSDLWLASVSGGTDIAGGFFVGNPTLAVYLGEMQCRALGAAIHAFDDVGRPVVDEVGELVCTRPLPSMPLYFWNDAGDVRYRESYFDTFQGPNGEPVWRHGDWLRLVPRSGAAGGIIYGRSDATINRGGIRMGTSELYRAVEAMPEVLDSMVVDLEYLGRESYMALFVVLRPGETLNESLDARMRRNIREALSARHVPNEIFQVPAVPRNLTGKKLELPIKKFLLGHPLDKVVKRDAMANPDALDWFLDFERELNRKPASA